jgi:elongation factor 1-alpha
MSQETQGKEHVGIVIVGHVDGGKSTLTGHLLFQLGGIDQRTMDKLKAEADALGKGSFSFAFFTDMQKEERARGITIKSTTKEFFTENKHYTIIDAPGHRDFVKNMITGASQADVALLMVPASSFEIAIAKGDRKTGQVEGQTRQHAMLCNLLGIQQMIVCVNKMDDSNVKWSEARFNEIRDEVTRMLGQVGWKNKLPEIPIIPLSAYLGDNLTKPTENMPWWKGFEVEVQGEKIKGNTLLDALNHVVKLPPRNADVPVRAPVNDIMRIKGVGDIVTARVEQGKLKKDDRIRFAPSEVCGRIFSMEMHHRIVEEALPGDSLGINVKDLPKDFKVQKGMCIVPASETGGLEVDTFRAQIQVQEHPGQLKSADDKGRGGFAPIVHVRTARAPCKLLKIHWKMGKSTGKQKVEDPAFVEKGDAAEVTFKTMQPLYLDKYENCAGLGRVAMMDSNSLVMLGRVKDVQYKPKAGK